MQLEQFIINFAEQFEDTPLEEFKSDTEFKALEEWSSLSTLAIVAMVDEEYGVAIRGEEIRECETVEDLFLLVLKRS